MSKIKKPENQDSHEVGPEDLEQEKAPPGKDDKPPGAPEASSDPKSHVDPKEDKDKKSFLENLRNRKITLDPAIQYRIKNVPIGTYGNTSLCCFRNVRMNMSVSAWIFSCGLIAVIISYSIYGILSLGTVSNAVIVYQNFKPFSDRPEDFCQKLEAKKN